MKFSTPQTIEGIARILNCDYIGDAKFPVLGMNEIHVVASGDIVFVDHPKYYDKALASKATIILINKQVSCPDGKSLLISDDPFRDFNKLTNHFKKNDDFLKFLKKLKSLFFICLSISFSTFSKTLFNT